MHGQHATVRYTAYESCTKNRVFCNSVWLLMKYWLLLPLLLISCSVVGVEEDPAQLRRSTWHLTHVIGVPGGIDPFPPDHVFSVHFFADGYMGGRLICNSYGGSYETIEDHRIGITPDVMTYVGCDRLGQETAFMAALDEARRYEINRNRLILRLRKRGVLIFEAEESQD